MTLVAWGPCAYRSLLKYDPSEFREFTHMSNNTNTSFCLTCYKSHLKQEVKNNNVKEFYLWSFSNPSQYLSSMIHFVLLISRQGKVRLAKWYSPYSQKERSKVCELDLIFNFHKAYFILDEILLAGAMQETSKRTTLRLIGAQEDLVEAAKEEASSLSNIIAQATK
ncbi:AP-1 complex subunit sigma-1 [Glycine soja]|nr:AP-1 complex subunit sigma-1 [Glycine soja]